MKTKSGEIFLAQTYGNSLYKSSIDNKLYEKYNVKKGLRNANGTGVLVLLTKISDVYGYKMEDGVKKDDEGHLYYRGYDISNLVNFNKLHYGFERICFLLLFSKLPTEEETIQFHNILSDMYMLPEGFVEDVIFRKNSRSTMNQIQKCILSMYSYDDSPDEADAYTTLCKGLDIIAKLPSIIAYSYRAKRHYHDGLSLHIRRPKPEYSIAENLLWMSRRYGEFTQEEAETLDLALILHADHGCGNNSTFSNVVISSTGTDIYSSMCASLGSLKGPRHGGANRAVNEQMKAIVSEIGLNAPDEEIIRIANRILDKDFNDKSGLIYGLGHAVYTLSDPRAILLREKCKELAETKDRTDLYNFYRRFEILAKEELKKRKNPDCHICTNVDFYSSLMYDILDISVDLFTPIFACARSVGWLAHNIENKLYCDKIIRPAGKYVGELENSV